MPSEKAALREEFLSLMAAKPMRDYSLDVVVQNRVGKFFADQAAERALRISMMDRATLRR